MAILSRNPFNHGHSSSSTHLNEKYEQSNHSSINHSTHTPQSNSNNNDNNTTTSNTNNNPPPLLKRSSKSFLSFLSRKPSMDSIRSDKSNESNYVINSGNNTPPNHDTTSSPRTNHHSHHNHNHNHTGSPANPHHHAHHFTSPHTGQKHHPYQSNHGSNSDLNGGGPTISPKPTHSMAELKRFFRSSKKSFVNLNHLAPTHTSSSSSAAAATGANNVSKESPLHNLQSPSNHHPYSTTTLNLNSHFLGPNDHKSHTNSAIPPSSDSVLSLSNTINIYHDDTILAQKYGKLGKTLGSGAGGSVKILVRPTDGATFAVKEFRPRKANEPIKQYAKKCTAEFCIGSSLHHPNVVQTIDIFSDFHQSKYFQVMEFLPVDFFAVVMTGLMSRGEINCCFKQIGEGVRYLHSMGLAHRDLKLDNCVMNSNGILKLIDFGSSVVFRYPFEDNITMAHGIVGSDPYLAPEVITSTKSYDPQYVDIWSMGIIFCCMMLKRFPWKAPKTSDDNFRLYSMPDDFPHDYSQSAKHHEHLLKERREKREQVNEHDQEHDHEQQPSHLHNSIPTSKQEEEHQQQENIKQLPTPPKEEEEQQLNNEPEQKNNEQPEQQNNETTLDENNNTPQEHHEHNKDEQNSIPNHTQDNHDVKSTASAKTQKTTNGPAAPGQKPTHGKKVIHGPYRLLRLLPHASRPILSRILEVDVSKRASMIDIFDDEWFDDIPCCTIDNKNVTIRAPGHHHTIVKDGKTYKI
ncbi:serine/threonine-protein kinase Hrk1p [Monosporozyma servazzii]